MLSLTHSLPPFLPPSLSRGTPRIRQNPQISAATVSHLFVCIFAMNVGSSYEGNFPYQNVSTILLWAQKK